MIDRQIVKSLYLSGDSLNEISKKYNCSRQYIHQEIIKMNIHRDRVNKLAWMNDEIVLESIKKYRFEDGLAWKQIANTGNKLPGVSIANKNRVWNPETLKLRIIRMSGSGNFRARKVRCVETGEIFLTTVDAARSCGSLSKSQISKCAKGKIKSAFGYKWEYA